MEFDLEVIILSTLLEKVAQFAEFSGENPNDLLNSFKMPDEIVAKKEEILQIATRDDQANDDAKEIVRIANQLALGLKDGSFAPPRPGEALVSVFDSVKLLKHQPGRDAFYRASALDFSKSIPDIFPKKDGDESNDFSMLFKEFRADVENLQTDGGIRIYLPALASLLEKYLWCVPAGGSEKLSGVSMYDFALASAGIAQALYKFHSSSGTSPNISDDSEKFLLVSGDLSGIQKYIFEISRNTGRGVSKIFRARSFYLQAVVQAILIHIEQEFGLYPVCRLIESGGKFILLFPNTADIPGRMDLLDAKIQKWFRRRFKGLLSLTFSWDTALTQQDFFGNRFKEKIDEMNESLEKAKFRKFKKTFTDDGLVIETEYDEADRKPCAICKTNANDEQARKQYLEEEFEELEDEPDIPICPDCSDQIAVLGKNLPKCSYLVYGKKGKFSLFGDRQNDAEPIGLDHIGLILFKEPPKRSDLMDVFRVESLLDDGKFQRVRIARYLPKLHQHELDDREGFRALFAGEFENEKAANQFLKRDNPKTFTMIAHKSKKVLKDEKGESKLVGRSLLAFYKADVDNLGLVFSIGMAKELSPARFSSVSRMLNLFFSEYLVKFAEKKYPDIYVVFAGGDDLFVVGPWNKVIEFAIDLREKLDEFSAKNPDITLSGGILPSKPRLPMRQAAYIVEEELEKAKHVPGKDAVCLLGETFSWNGLKDLIELGKWFDECIDEKERTRFSSAFLYRLLCYHRMYRDFRERKVINCCKYISQAHYDIGRNISRRKGENKEEVERLHKIFAVGVTERPELQNLNIPLFYALNLNRD